MALRAIIVGPEEKAAIDGIVSRARLDPLPLELVLAMASKTKNTQTGDTLSLADRGDGLPARPQPESITLGDFRVAFSFEQQPCGLVRHISISLAEPGKLPHPDQVAFIVNFFQFDRPLGDRWWREEFAPGKWAINVVELAEPAAEQATL